MKRVIQWLGLLVLAFAMLSACYPTKRILHQSSENEATVTNRERTSEIHQAAEAEYNVLTSELTQGESMTVRQETTEGIAAEEVQMTIPTQNLLELPEGAQYSDRNGRASVAAKRCDGNLIITGRCDSIARLCKIYEATVFRQRSLIDSLEKTNGIYKDSLAKEQCNATARSGTTEQNSMEEYRPSVWYKWLLSGIMVGVALSVAASVLWRRTRLGLVIKCLIGKIL